MTTAIASEELAKIAAEAALSRKAQAVTVLDLRGIASFTDYFVLCTGTSDTHVEGIAEIVDERMTEAGQRRWHREGKRRSDWVLLDFVDCVVHIFTREAREFYALERLWADATVTVYDEDRVEVDAEWEAEETRAESLTHYTAMDDLNDDAERDNREDT